MEEWRSVVGYEGFYEVSDFGRVRSVDRLVRNGRSGKRLRLGQEMRPYEVDEGHLRLCLRRDGRTRNRFVHHLVLEAFVGPCPDGLEACHGNGVPSDNRLSNLRWDTRSSNALDRVDHGRDNHRSRTSCPDGHEYTPENTLMDRGRRRCRECNRIKCSDYYYKRKQVSHA